jgi:hypothetical protein
MKKLVLSAAAIAMITLQSCEEKGVKIDFGTIGATDSSYTAAVETPQVREVLIEEFTGASCTNCPAGHEVVNSIISSNPGRIVAIAYHTFNGGSVFKPVKDKSIYDFRDTAATDIGTNIYGSIGSIPIAGIDRVPLSGDMRIDRNFWPSQVNNRLPVTTPVNLSLSSKYSASNNQVTVVVKVSYTQAVNKKQLLSIGVLESGIIDAQEYPDSVALNYVHNHIFRKCLTSQYYGTPILDSVSTKQPGLVYQYTYTFVPSASWKLENCAIVAYVANNESGDKEIAQAAEVSLK